MKVFILLAAVLGAGSLRVEAADSQNEIYAALVETADLKDLAIRLPQPLLPDGLDAQGQRQALARLADDNHPLEALLRKSVVAPFVIKISDERTPGAGLVGTNRRFEAWFVVHADFSRITSEDFLLNQITPDAMGSDSKSDFHGRKLTDNELQSHGIVLASQERLFHLSFNLFDRVQLASTHRAVLTRTAESALVAGRIDPRFDKDIQLPNHWQPLTRDALGQLQTGGAQPYRAAGWYMKVTRLHEPPGANFVEYHIGFDEPHAWFDGANLLRSKLPLLSQDAIRRFRRKAADSK